ncbi:hypothetical protein HG530_010162 [Fusarium avenaceum]|nr:hypothetical protein HG530_010162 [Fusarium avenaceum]
MFSTQRFDLFERTFAFFGKALGRLKHCFIIAGILYSLSAFVDDISKRRDNEVGDIIHDELGRVKIREQSSERSGMVMVLEGKSRSEDEVGV